MKIDTFRIGLIVIICCVLIFLIILGIILLIKWYKKQKRRKYQLNTSINNSTRPTDPSERPTLAPPDSVNNNMIPKTRKKDYLTKEKKINAYCDCFLKPVKYSSIKVYNESCPIDLIPFSPDDEVSVTKCLHCFHYLCIKKYLLENDDHNELKCPICLTVLLELNSKN